jgi:hypothetical protein
VETCCRAVGRMSTRTTRGALRRALRRWRWRCGVAAGGSDVVKSKWSAQRSAQSTLSLALVRRRDVFARDQKRCADSHRISRISRILSTRFSARLLGVAWLAQGPLSLRLRRGWWPRSTTNMADTADNTSRGREHKASSAGIQNIRIFPRPGHKTRSTRRLPPLSPCHVPLHPRRVSWPPHVENRAPVAQAVESKS